MWETLTNLPPEAYRDGPWMFLGIVAIIAVGVLHKDFQIVVAATIVVYLILLAILPVLKGGHGAGLDARIIGLYVFPMFAWIFSEMEINWKLKLLLFSAIGYFQFFLFISRYVLLLDR